MALFSLHINAKKEPRSIYERGSSLVSFIYIVFYQSSFNINKTRDDYIWLITPRLQSGILPFQGI